MFSYQAVTIDYFKKYDYFLIYHPKYIYDHDDDSTSDNSPWKKFKVLITKEMNEKDFNYQDAEEPDLSSKQIKSDAPFIIGGINFAASGIIFDSARTKFGKKENNVINSFLLPHKCFY